MHFCISASLLFCISAFLPLCFFACLSVLLVNLHLHCLDNFFLFLALFACMFLSLAFSFFCLSWFVSHSHLIATSNAANNVSNKDVPLRQVTFDALTLDALFDELIALRPLLGSLFSSLYPKTFLSSSLNKQKRTHRDTDKNVCTSSSFRCSRASLARLSRVLLLLNSSRGRQGRSQIKISITSSFLVFFSLSCYGGCPIVSPSSILKGILENSNYRP